MGTQRQSIALRSGFNHCPRHTTKRKRHTNALKARLASEANAHCSLFIQPRHLSRARPGAQRPVPPLAVRRNKPPGTRRTPTQPWRQGAHPARPALVYVRSPFVVFAILLSTSRIAEDDGPRQPSGHGPRPRRYDATENRDVGREPWHALALQTISRQSGHAWRSYSGSVRRRRVAMRRSR